MNPASRFWDVIPTIKAALLDPHHSTTSTVMVNLDDDDQKFNRRCAKLLDCDYIWWHSYATPQGIIYHVVADDFGRIDWNEKSVVTGTESRDLYGPSLVFGVYPDDDDFSLRDLSDREISLLGKSGQTLMHPSAYTLDCYYKTPEEAAEYLERWEYRCRSA